MEGMIGEVRAVAQSIFLGGDWTFLAMVVVAIIIGVMAMKNFGQILCVSLLGLVALAVIWIGYGSATSESPTDPSVWMSNLEAGWASLGSVSGVTLVSYLIIFAVVIGVLFLARSLLFRG